MPTVTFDKELVGGITRPDVVIGGNTSTTTTILPSTVDLGHGYQGTVTPSSSTSYNADQWQTYLNGQKTDNNDIVPPSTGDVSMDDKGGSTGSFGEPTTVIPSIEPLGTSNVDYDSIQKELDRIMGDLFKGDMFTAGKNIGDYLARLQQYLRSELAGLDKDEATQLAGQLYNTVTTYMSSVYNNLYNRQNWLLECSYNSPKNQIARLMEAGVNPAFYFGSMGNSDAGQIGDSSMTPSAIDYQPQSPFSDAGQKILQGISTAGEIANSAMGIANGFANFKETISTARNLDAKTKTENMMRIPQLAQSFLNMGSTFANTTYTLTQNDRIKALLPHEQRQMSLTNTKLGKEIRNADSENEVMKSTAYNNYASGYSALGSLQLGIANLDQTWQIEKMRNRLGYAQISAEYAKMQNDMRIARLNNDYTSAREFLQTLANKHEETSYSEYSGGVWAEVGGELSAEIDAMIAKQSVKLDASGGFELNGKRYRMNRTTKSTLNPDVVGTAYDTLHWLLRNGFESNDSVLTSPEKFNHFMGNQLHFFGHAFEEFDNKMINAFGNYVTDSVFKGSKVQYDPTKLYR